MTERELIELMADGDQSAFAALYELYWKAVYNYAWMLAQSPAEAEDLTQECFLALVTKPRSFDPARAQLRTWLLGVVCNRFLDRRRKRMRETLLAEFEHDRPVQAGFEDELIGIERAEAVRRALASLPAAQNEALYRFEFEGLSLAEISAVLGIEANAVKARLYRGRERLKCLLGSLRPAGAEK